MTYTAKVRAKGLDATGVTEEVAKTMYATLGQTTLAIVELAHVEHSDTSAGDHSTALTIELLEPVLSERAQEHVRELMRALYQDRRTKAGDTLPGTEFGPGLDDTLAQGEAVIDREPDGSVAGTWDGSLDDEDMAEELASNVAQLEPKGKGNRT